MFSNMYQPFVRAIPVTFALTLLLHVTAFAATVEQDMALVNRTSKAFVNIVKKAKPAVVHIKVEKNSRQPSDIDQQLDDIFNNPLFEQFFARQAVSL